MSEPAYCEAHHAAHAGPSSHDPHVRWSLTAAWSLMRLPGPHLSQEQAEAWYLRLTGFPAGYIEDLSAPDPLDGTRP